MCYIYIVVLIALVYTYYIAVVLLLLVSCQHLLRFKFVEKADWCGYYLYSIPLLSFEFKINLYIVAPCVIEYA